MLPTLAETNSKPRSASAPANRSIATSWLPTASSVRSIEATPRSARAGSVVPGCAPSVKREIVTIAFARDSEVMTPAPRRNGIATTRSPTRAATTRMNSSSPNGENTLRVRVTSKVAASGGSRCASRSISGARKSSAQIAALTGYPGMPSSGTRRVARSLANAKTSG